MTDTQTLITALEGARVIVEKWCHYQGNTQELFDQYLKPIDKALAASALPARVSVSDDEMDALWTKITGLFSGDLVRAFGRAIQDKIRK